MTPTNLSERVFSAVVTEKDDPNRPHIFSGQSFEELAKILLPTILQIETSGKSKPIALSGYGLTVTEHQGNHQLSTREMQSLMPDDIERIREEFETGNPASAWLALLIELTDENNLKIKWPQVQDKISKQH